jgi:serine/threonine-protein kinase
VPGRNEEDPTFTPQGREIFERLKDATVGRYEVLKELGRGGMAVVFLGFQKSLDRHVAVKVLLPILGYDPEIVERFMREARTQGKLDHPNIIQVYEIYNEGGLTFFTVPYISGESLRVYLRDEPTPPFEKVFRYLTQAADALAYAHRRGVVHRDVKPDNILLDKERDRVILTDFGIAKALAAETTLTTPGDLLGTPQYMSPEQGEGRQDLDGRADQYCLGLIGYEMLAGQRPFQADNLAELMYMHRFEEPTSIEELRPEAPRNLREAISRAISKDRDDRFPTMDAFLAALEGPWDVEEGERDRDDRTEPMPPPGADATTVRVPTPPATPRPSRLLDDTTPEPSRPPSRPKITQPKVPTPGRPDDTPEPWAASTAEPWSASPAEVAEQEAGGTVLLGESARRRPGPPRALFLGGGAAVVVLLIVFFVFGPFGTGGDSGSPQSELAVGEGAQELTVAPAEGDDAGVVLSQEQEGAGEEETTGTPSQEAAGDQETPAGGPEAGAAAAGAVVAAVETEQTPPADPPEETPVETAATEQRARAAQQRANDYRASAVAAGAERVVPEELAELDRRKAEADGHLEAGRYSSARTEFSALIIAYRDLVGAAQAGSSAARTAADESRQLARSQHDAAVAAGAAILFSGQLEPLDSRLQQAEQAFEEGRFAEAGAAFQGLSSDYEQLAGRAETEMQSRVRAARDEMAEQRLAALTAGAQQGAADQLAAGDAIRDGAVQAARDVNYAAALSEFGRARDAYAQLAADLAAQAAEAEQPAGGEEMPAEAEGVGAVAPEVAITALIESFRLAFEAEDLERMGADVYRSAVPGADERTFRLFFDRAEDLRATATIQRLQVEDDAATADVELAMRFRQARTGQPGSMDQTFRLRFVLDAGGWRLERAQRR